LRFRVSALHDLLRLEHENEEHKKAHTSMDQDSRDICQDDILPEISNPLRSNGDKIPPRIKPSLLQRALGGLVPAFLGLALVLFPVWENYARQSVHGYWQTVPIFVIGLRVIMVLSMVVMVITVPFILHTCIKNESASLMGQRNFSIDGSSEPVHIHHLFVISSRSSIIDSAVQSTLDSLSALLVPLGDEVTILVVLLTRSSQFPIEQRQLPMGDKLVDLFLCSVNEFMVGRSYRAAAEAAAMSYFERHINSHGESTSSVDALVTVAPSGSRFGNFYLNEVHRSYCETTARRRSTSIWQPVVMHDVWESWFVIRTLVFIQDWMKIGLFIPGRAQPLDVYAFPLSLAREYNYPDTGYVADDMHAIHQACVATGGACLLRPVYTTVVAGSDNKWHDSPSFFESCQHLWISQFRVLARIPQEFVYLLAAFRRIAFLRWIQLMFQVLTVDVFIIILGVSLCCYTWLESVPLGIQISAIAIPLVPINDGFGIIASVPAILIIIALYIIFVRYEKKNLLWKRKNRQYPNLDALLKLIGFIVSPVLLLMFVSIPGLIAFLLYAIGIPTPPPDSFLPLPRPKSHPTEPPVGLGNKTRQSGSPRKPTPPMLDRAAAGLGTLPRSESLPSRTVHVEVELV